MFLLGIMLCICPWVGNHAKIRETSFESSVCIPLIDVTLPVYEGTEEEILQKGVGHILWSSPLTGGKDTHCLLAGHRGIPGAMMFARLNELEQGDVFYMETDGEKRMYEVCEIQVVRPEETQGLGVQKGRELVSLITCTPYGINSHRLVVTGERVDGKE